MALVKRQDCEASRCSAASLAAHRDSGHQRTWTTADFREGRASLPDATEIDVMRIADILWSW